MIHFYRNFKHNVMFVIFDKDIDQNLIRFWFYLILKKGVLTRNSAKILMLIECVKPFKHNTKYPKKINQMERMDIEQRKDASF